METIRAGAGRLWVDNINRNFSGLGGGAYHVETYAQGSGETDNEFIQRVIDDAAADDVRRVVLGDRTYNMEGGLTISHACDLVGSGRNSTQLVAAGTFTNMIVLDDVFASVSNMRLKGGNTVTNGIRIEAQGTSNCDIRISDLLMERFATDIYSLGSDGIHVERVQSRLATVQFFKSDDNCLNSTFDSIYVLTATGGDGLIFNKSSQQAEGVTVTNSHFLTPSGKGLRYQAALSCHHTNVVFDQGGEPLDLDFSGGSDAGLGLSFHGCWFNGKTGNGAVNIQGNPNSIDFDGCTFAHAENYGVQIGASAQNISLRGCLFQSSGSTASSVGIVQLGAKGVRVIGCSFNGYSGSAKNVAESAGSTTMYDLNRFDIAPTYGTDIASTSLARTNYGLGAAAATGAYKLFLDDGTAAAPALSFANDQDAGFYKTGNGFAASVGGVAAAEWRSAGLYQVSGKGWFGAEAVINDDAALSFTPPASSGIMTIRIDEGAFEVEYRAVGGLSRCVIISASVLTQFAVTTGALTGTTGTDTKLTVSAHTDGLIYIENRRGSAKTVSYAIRA